jgi:proteinaceous RNase P
VDAEATRHGLELTEADLARLLAVAARSSADAVPWTAVETVLARLTREHGRLAPPTVAAAAALFRARGWTLARAAVDPETGAVAGAGGNSTLAGIDLTDGEWGAFVDGVAALARDRERRPSDFDAFTAWLDEHGPYDAVIDGANVALFGQNWERGGFDFGQVESVLNALEAARPGARPLVVLHRSRTSAPPAREPEGRALLARLRAAGALYAAPHGSNDDWYWLHAAVAARGAGLLISNDEMRDHTFAMLAPRFVGRWKERHQVKYEFGYGGARLAFPRPFSVCAQRLDSGVWVLPPGGGEEEEGGGEGVWDGWLVAAPPEGEGG